MRRLAAIPAFAILLALPLWAQHGGGHGGGGGHAGGGGGHAGFSGGHSGGFSGGGHAGGFSGGSVGVHAYSGPQSRSVAPRSFTRPPSSVRPFSRPPISQNRFRGSGIRTFGFRNNCYGCRGYGYYPWAYGYYDPYWWWDSDSSDNNDNDNGYDQDVAAAAEMNQQNLAQQNDEQQMMRQEQADGDQDLYANRVPMRPAMHQSDGAPVLPNTVLVFRDEHKQEISNYAIVGQTLWNFAPQHTQKIPLSDLDLPATTKANEDRGLTFRVPASGEAQ